MIVGRQVIYLPRVTSTMEEIERYAAAGEPEGVVVVADEQTAGRGRSGRTWRAPAGSSILCSILLRPKLFADHLTTIPLIAGVAVAEAIEEHVPVRCHLKWPNDVWIDSKKVAGILMTSRMNSSGVAHVNLGIGVNVTVPREALPDGATSLDAASGCNVARDRLLTSLLTRLDAHYACLLTNGPHSGLSAWRGRAALIGEHVVVKAEDREETGRFVGIDDDGALLLAQDGGTKRIVAGDLTRGPRALEQTP
ncbi:MAG: biotin--[acetyl-CoA-carboxylase] ligase [Thermomicrobiales bacterium]